METTPLTFTKEESEALLAGLDLLIRETHGKKHLLGTTGCAEAVAKLVALAGKVSR